MVVLGHCLRNNDMQKKICMCWADMPFFPWVFVMETWRACRKLECPGSVWSRCVPLPVLFIGSRIVWLLNKPLLLRFCFCFVVLTWVNWAKMVLSTGVTGCAGQSLGCWFAGGLSGPWSVLHRLSLSPWELVSVSALLWKQGLFLGKPSCLRFLVTPLGFSKGYVFQHCPQ